MPTLPVRTVFYLLAATALLLSACKEELLREEIPVGEQFVSVRYEESLAYQKVGGDDVVRVEFTSDSSFVAFTAVNTCTFNFERAGLASWNISEIGGCSEVCCDSPLTENILVALAGGELRLASGTLIAGSRDGAGAAVIFQ